MTPDPYDQSPRYLLKRSPEEMLGWLLGLDPTQADFVGWLDTRRIPLPGNPERTRDTVAWLRDVGRGGLPWSVVSFSLRPDPEMFGRLLIYLGSVWLEIRPSPLPDDRFRVGSMVVNLTGRAESGRDLAWEGAEMRTLIRPLEWSLAEQKAEKVLEAVEAGVAPRAALAVVP